MISTILEILVFGAIISSLYALISVGFTIIYSVGGVLDISYPAWLMVGAYIYLVVSPIISPALGLLVTILCVSGLAVLIYRCVIRPLSKNPLLVVIVTLILTLIISQILLIIFGGSNINMFPLIPGITKIWGVTFHTNMLFVMVVSWTSLAAFGLFVKKTYAGRAILATSMDPKGALIVGINPSRILTLVYAVAGAFTGMAALSYGSFTTVNPHMWLFPLIITLAIALVGGLGSIRGAVIAAIIIGFSEIMTTYFWDPKARGITALIFVIVILCIRPKGLFGREAVH